MKGNLYNMAHLSPPIRLGELKDPNALSILKKKVLWTLFQPVAQLEGVHCCNHEVVGLSYATEQNKKECNASY